VIFMDLVITTVLKTKVTFTWNALTKAYAIGGLVYANVLMATPGSTAALPCAQMIAAVTGGA